LCGLLSGLINSEIMVRIDFNVRFLLSLVLLGSIANESARAAVMALNPSQDTYLSEHFAGPNGKAVDMVIGTQGSTSGLTKNRGLIQFDLSSLPPGAVVNSVTLRLTVSRQPSTPANSNFHLHRLLRPWDASESTWPLRLGEEDWDIPGGQEGTDFSVTSSASVFVADLVEDTFPSTPQLVADVNAWLTDPSTNHGWLVKTEDESIGYTARRFASAEGGPAAPLLEIDFAAPVLLRITSTEITGGQFCLRFVAQQGKAYVVERRDRLDGGIWTVIRHLPPAGTTGEVVVCDPVGTSNAFYRVGEE
jgi:hypothetical protein